MNTLAANKLPDDIDALKALLLSKDEQLLTTQNRVRFLEEFIAHLEEQQRIEKARKFAPSSEKGVHQYSLFNEAEELTAQESPDETEEKIIDVSSYSKRKTKKPLPESLPVEEIVYELEGAQALCDCGCALTCIGEHSKEQIDIIPMQLKRIRHVQKKYVCRQCDSAPILAARPKQPIPKSQASPGFLAFITTAKYVDGLPLYRLGKLFERQGIEIGRNRLANYMVDVGSRVVTPLIEAMQAHIKRHDIVHMDETCVQVLNEPGRTAQSKSYMWVMKGGPPHQPAINYHYAPSRAQDVPIQLLSGYEGYLQTDGYAGYNGILKEADIKGVGCMAHARRKFIEAEKALPSKQKKSNAVANQFLLLIRKLYAVEKQQRDTSIAERYRARQEKSLVLLEKLHKLAMHYQSLVVPSSALGKAINYLLSQWERLVVYCEDGRLNIDNNPIENAIRPFVIGRKNWLFSNSQAGATASAALYSLVETAKANGHDPYKYLRWVFTELPNVTSEDELMALLPWSKEAKLFTG